MKVFDRFYAGSKKKRERETKADYQFYSFAATAKSLQSCPTLCNPMDCSLPGSSVHGIFQARVLEWVAIAFSYSFRD